MKKRRFISFVFVLILCLGMIGCGKEKKTPVSDKFQVFEMSVGQQELEEVKEKFEISNLFRKDGQIIVRVVTQKRPEGYDEIREAAPTLEDVYLYEFEVKGAMHNNAVRKIAGT